MPRPFAKYTDNISPSWSRDKGHGHMNAMLTPYFKDVIGAQQSSSPDRASAASCHGQCGVTPGPCAQQHPLCCARWCTCHQCATHTALPPRIDIAALTTQHWLCAVRCPFATLGPPKSATHSKSGEFSQGRHHHALSGLKAQPAPIPIRAGAWRMAGPLNNCLPRRHLTQRMHGKRACTRRPCVMDGCLHWRCDPAEGRSSHAGRSEVR